MRSFKKFTLLALAVFSLFAAVACSKTEKASYQLFNKAGVDTRITYYYQGDRVTKQVNKGVELYSVYGIKSPEEAKKQSKATFDKYKNIKGVTLKTDYGKDRLTSSLEIDYNKADIKEVIKIMEADDTEGADYISYKKSAKLLKKAGFKEIKNDKFESLK